MPRPKKQPAPKPVEPDPEIIPDGDYAGMAVDDVLRLTTDRVHDSLGDVDLDVAGAALDMAMGEYLQITAHSAGKMRAKEAATAFMATAYPYARGGIEDGSPTYRRLRNEVKK